MKKLPLLLGLATFALPLSASARYYYGQYQTELQHECGSQSGTAWKSTDACVWQFTTYGPYATNLPAYVDLLAVSSFRLKSNGHPDGLGIQFDVYDSARGEYLGFANVRHGTSSNEARYVPAVPFYLESGANVQVRTRQDGYGTMYQCGVQILGPQDVVDALAPGSMPYHQVGRAAGGTWLASEDEGCQNGACAGKFISYGPYSSLPQNGDERFADFHLGWQEISGGAPTSENEVIAAVDVTARLNGQLKILASRSIVRKELQAVGVSPRFALKFNTGNAALNQFEYRVRWYGKGRLSHYRTTVYQGGSPECVL